MQWKKKVCSWAYLNKHVLQIVPTFLKCIQKTNVESFNICKAPFLKSLNMHQTAYPKIVLVQPSVKGLRKAYYIFRNMIDKYGHSIHGLPLTSELFSCEENNILLTRYNWNSFLFRINIIFKTSFFIPWRFLLYSLKLF